MLENGMTIGATIGLSKFNLESTVRKLAAFPNSFVISLLDCCREAQRGDVTTKGGDTALPEKIAGQFAIVHAVSPNKAAVATRGGPTSVSEVSFFSKSN